MFISIQIKYCVFVTNNITLLCHVAAKLMDECINNFKQLELLLHVCDNFSNNCCFCQTDEETKFNAMTWKKMLRVDCSWISYRMVRPIMQIHTVIHSMHLREGVCWNRPERFCKEDILLPENAKRHIKSLSKIG